MRKNWPWILLVVVTVALWFCAGVFLFDFLFESKQVFIQRTREAEKERVIKTYTILTPRGEIQVTELRSGTEFNRILQMPGGAVIAESGWVNRWGEEQIRMIGQVQDTEDP